MQRAALTLLWLAGAVLAHPRPEGARTCTLARESRRVSDECFSEPECREVCTPVTERNCSLTEEEQCRTFEEMQCGTVLEEKCTTVESQSCRPISEEICETDIVLIARSPEALHILLSIVQHHCSSMKMQVSVLKSKAMSDSPDLWAMFDGEEVTGCLDKVLAFKYLGMESTLSPARSANLMRKRALNLARRYKACCLRVSRSGPDTVEVGLATWNNIAMPSVMYGCEAVPFNNTALDSIDRMQAAVAKGLTGLPVSAPNLVAQTVLGMRYARHRIYEAQLKFFLRVCMLDRGRWSRDAMECHLAGRWVSPYIAHITKVKMEVGMVAGPISKRHVEIVLDHHFLAVTNAKISALHLPALEPIDKFAVMGHVEESDESQVLTSWLLSTAPVGARGDLKDVPKKKFCPACEGITDEVFNLTLPHVLQVCEAVSGYRDTVGLTNYFNHCKALGLGSKASYTLYLTGRAPDSSAVSMRDYRERGTTLEALRREWLSTWYQS